MNLKIREFKLSMENYINSSDLPWEIKKMVLKELYNNATEQSDKAVLEEIKERDSENQEDIGNAESAQ